MKRMFDFKCNDCQEVFSKLVKDDIKYGIPCKYCASDDTIRIISSTKSIQFNGTGFYETDYKHKR